VAVHAVHLNAVKRVWDHVCAVRTGKVGSCRQQQLLYQLLLLLLLLFLKLVKGVSEVTVESCLRQSLQQDRQQHIAAAEYIVAHDRSGSTV
jgi:hypothetical protein